MKTYQVVTLFPEMIQSSCAVGVLGQAQKSRLVKIETHNPRKYTSDVHKTVDDRPFGGGDGMLMLAEPLAQTLEALPERGRVIYLSPQGTLLTDAKAQSLAREETLTLICGRYGGVDQRFLNRFVDEEISIGDYVLSGGELAAAVLIDACSRFVPGVLGHSASAANDSVTSGRLEAPAFTRPREWRGEVVPEILLSGHHEKMLTWQEQVGRLCTLHKRPDLVPSNWSEADRKALRKFWDGLSDQDRKALNLEDFDVGKL